MHVVAIAIHTHPVQSGPLEGEGEEQEDHGRSHVCLLPRETERDGIDCLVCMLEYYSNLLNSIRSQ